MKSYKNTAVCITFSETTELATRSAPFVLPAGYPSATIECERVPLQVSSKALTGPTDPPGARLAGQGLTLRTA